MTVLKCPHLPQPWWWHLSPYPWLDPSLLSLFQLILHANPWICHCPGTSIWSQSFLNSQRCIHMPLQWNLTTQQCQWPSNPLPTSFLRAIHKQLLPLFWPQPMWCALVSKQPHCLQTHLSLPAQKTLHLILLLSKHDITSKSSSKPTKKPFSVTALLNLIPNLCHTPICHTVWDERFLCIFVCLHLHYL